MKLSISNIAWSEDKDNIIYNYMKKSEFLGLEIAPTRIYANNPYKYLKEISLFAEKIKKEYGFVVSSMQSIWYGKNENIFSSEEERSILIDYTKKAIDFAAACKCENLVFGCPKNRIIESDEQYDIAIEFFRTIGTYAEEKNTVIAIEPNPTIYGTNFINTTNQAFTLAKDVDCLGIKVNVDFGTVIFNNETIDEIENNIKWVNHIHISEPFLERIQKRELHNDLAKFLKSNGYDKFVSIEMKNQTNDEVVFEAIDYVREVFS